MVFGETMLTEAFATAAGEHQGGGVEQHDREVGEQVTPAFEQRFLDQILGPSGCPCGAALVGQRLTQPGHGAIELVQRERVGALDMIGVQPRVAGTVRARYDQPVQDTGEHRAFEREAEAAVGGEMFDHRGATGLLPQPAEDHRRADARGGGGLECSGLQAGDQQRGLGQPRTGASQGIELAGGFEVLDAPEGGDDALARGGAVAGVLHDLQVAALSGRFDAEEHATTNRGFASPVWQIPTSVGRLYATTWHRTVENILGTLRLSTWNYLH